MRAYGVIFGICLTLLSSSGLVRAEMMVLGYGGVSCGGWTKAHHPKSVEGLAQDNWVLGYVTGFNAYSGIRESNISAGTDNEALIAWIDNYCRSNPLDSIYIASVKLIHELKKKASSPK